jgi:hypothetical protein
MNDTFNSNLESDQSTDSGQKDSQDSASRYLEFIELLIDKSIERLKRRTYRPRIQDALKAIQLKEKVVKAVEAEEQKAFWDMIEEVRQEELPKLYPESKPEPIDLESQIINTIKGLYYQVTNGTLPVKTITDRFNYGKPDEKRLSNSRIGRILSAMGFRKTRISNGRSAIFWDDRLLSDDPPDVQSESGGLSERSEITAESGAPADNSPEVDEAFPTDPTEKRYTLPPPSSLPRPMVASDSNSTVSNVCNSLPDNDLEEK